MPRLQPPTAHARLPASPLGTLSPRTLPFQSITKTKFYQLLKTKLSTSLIIPLRILLCVVSFQWFSKIHDIHLSIEEEKKRSEILLSHHHSSKQKTLKVTSAIGKRGLLYLLKNNNNNNNKCFDKCFALSNRRERKDSAESVLEQTGRKGFGRINLNTASYWEMSLGE